MCPQWIPLVLIEDLGVSFLPAAVKTVKGAEAEEDPDLIPAVSLLTKLGVSHFPLSPNFLTSVMGK